MGFISWLLVGLIAGTLAKMITPQQEKGGWISSLVVGVIGSFVGGFLGGLIGISSTHFIGELLIAFVGAIFVLYIYHKYLAEKMNNII